MAEIAFEKLRELGEHITACNFCAACNRPNSGIEWCRLCSPHKNLSTGNSEIDEILYSRQIHAKNCDEIIEYVPHSDFKDIRQIGQGGFAFIYTATWEKKTPQEVSIPVVLKKSKNPIHEFIGEIRVHCDCSLANNYITQLYGITKDPITEEFMMVLEYASKGNLRQFLKNANSSELSWKNKTKILYDVIYDLHIIHKKGYVHKDLHSGNILCFDYYTKISDMGLSQSVYDSKPTVYGVMPYIAPEVLENEKYTYASDIYSFGIIMAEVSLGKPPYAEYPHDESLALAICNGLRPGLSAGTPEPYCELFRRCTDTVPEKRPSSEEIVTTIRAWLLFDEFEGAEMLRTPLTQRFIRRPFIRVVICQFKIFLN
ncbi:Cdc15p [Rhizophagus irregularis DAOM 197198w]|uniref:Cdc15p n=1 Tax=Rhizophagus irregularis (strain DAOM 197198w) TaxID=1432141 RepID=A0A015JY15_RHIIW|nr:Cdc15p [Rhizophagus irregularis DAOM 197198w]EXX74432.1 Cdc15p [Rhizophagus irregularis DAOM 197198w]